MTICKTSYSWLGSFKVTAGKGSVAIHVTNVTSHRAVSPVLPTQHVSMQSTSPACMQYSKASSYIAIVVKDLYLYPQFTYFSHITFMVIAKVPRELFFQ